MKKNFTIPDSASIQIDQNYIDLHNWFFFQSAELEFPKKCFSIVFRETIGKRFARIDFINVKHLSLKVNSSFELNQIISEIGYKEKNNFDHDWLTDENKSRTSDHFFIRLVDDNYIRVYSEDAIASSGAID